MQKLLIVQFRKSMFIIHRLSYHCIKLIIKKVLNYCYKKNYVLKTKYDFYINIEFIQFSQWITKIII